MPFSKDPEIKKQQLKRLSDAKKGSIPWNKGKKMSDEQREKLRQAKLKNPVKYYLGKKRSKETREKISKSLKGRFTGEDHPMYGINHTDEVKVKMSMCKIGDNHWNWKGGISNDPYCEVWKDKEYKSDIKKRDENRCQNPFCRKIKSTYGINLHHIDYNKQNCRPENLIAICHSCNVRANYERSFWQFFYTNLILAKINKIPFLTGEYSLEELRTTFKNIL